MEEDFATEKDRVMGELAMRMKKRLPSASAKGRGRGGKPV